MARLDVLFDGYGNDDGVAGTVSLLRDGDSLRGPLSRSSSRCRLCAASGFEWLTRCKIDVKDVKAEKPPVHGGLALLESSSI